jgi:hypothetical protein
MTGKRRFHWQNARETVAQGAERDDDAGNQEEIGQKSLHAAAWR